MSKRDNWNVNELLYLIHQQDEEAFDLLYEQSLPIIHLIHKNCAWLIEIEDWKSEAMICLERAINRYREDLSVAFFSLFVTFLRHRSCEILRASQAKKSIPSSAICPYESLDKEGKILLVEETSAYRPSQEEGNWITKITCDQVLDQLSSHLDEIERKSLELLRQGYSQVLIAKILNTNPSKVRRAQQKAMHIYASLNKKAVL